MFSHNLSSRFMLATTIAVIIAMSANFLWERHQLQRQAYMELQEKASVITMQMLATREFIARHQDRINYDAHGNFEFKGLNPAAVGTGIGEIFGQLTDYRIKQTRIDARNPYNLPDEYEQAILHAFHRGSIREEVWSRQIIDGKHFFRYLIPLYANESCLPCHGEPFGTMDVAGYPREGYRLGELAGAISVMMPMDIFISNFKASSYRHFGFTMLLLGIILGCVYMLLNRLVTNPLAQLKEAAIQVGQGNWQINLDQIKAKGEIKELALQFQDMASQLGRLYGDLEGEVDKRTQELSLANQELQGKQIALESANRELSTLNQHKSQFLATISHELRTPLTAIIAFAELMEKQLPTEDDLNRQNVKEIRSNGENLLVLINDLLDLAQIEAGRYELRVETMDLIDVIDSVERVIQPLAYKKQIDFASNFLTDVPLFKGDPEKIRRAVLNLVDNAVKFTPPGGRVNISVEYNHQKRVVTIAVSDNGIGIKTEDLPYIFERFRQLDSSNMRRYRGSGLGLALTKELMEMHGGWVGVTSEGLGKGSVFTLGLPLEELQGVDFSETDREDFIS